MSSCFLFDSYLLGRSSSRLEQKVIVVTRYSDQSSGKEVLANVYHKLKCGNYLVFTRVAIGNMMRMQKSKDAPQATKIGNMLSLILEFSVKQNMIIPRLSMQVYSRNALTKNISCMKVNTFFCALPPILAKVLPLRQKPRRNLRT